ncbi:MAG: hypothetical protein M1832_003940 [Thelocarpon impressellum]|nr:MAG: hypothetical protein M1832_003940 [Thelocarpon impressellum]
MKLHDITLFSILSLARARLVVDCLGEQAASAIDPGDHVGECDDVFIRTGFKVTIMNTYRGLVLFQLHEAPGQLTERRVKRKQDKEAAPIRTSHSTFSLTTLSSGLYRGEATAGDHGSGHVFDSWVYRVQISDSSLAEISDSNGGVWE